MTFADEVLEFHSSLKIRQSLPLGVEVLNPYQDEIASSLCKIFYKRFYDDKNERTLIVGINPGRFGGGLTGIPFTDPVKLETYCSIPNNLPKKVELSADFIYKAIEAYGGSKEFYSKFYFTSISPLGFTKDGKNLNYYDIRELQESIMDFIVDCLKTQLAFGVNTKCYCLGEGSNFKFFTKLNEKYKFFKTITPLPHPRFIMQYRRKQINSFIQEYLKAFQSIN